MKTTPQGIPYDEFFENLLKEVAISSDLQVERSEENKKLWKVFSGEGKTAFFYGYDLGLNSSSVETVCRDKYLVWLLLNEDKEVNKYSEPLKMSFFNGYGRTKISFEKTLSSELYDFVDRGEKFVLKPVIGSGGSSVYKIENKFQVDRALQSLGTRNSFISTKFLPISAEYRFIFACPDNSPELLLCFKKVPLKIKGDGKRTIKELIFEKISALREGVELDEIWKDIEVQLSSYDFKMGDVLESEKEIDITWRLNQVIGAEISLIDIEKDGIIKGVSEVAKQAFKVLGMGFGSVDVAEFEEKGERKHLILEVNTSVLTDLFDYYDYDKMLDLTKKSVNRLVNSFKVSSVDSDENLRIIKSQEKDKIDDNLFSTYKGKSSLKRSCVKDACKSLNVNVKFYSQDYLVVIKDKQENKAFMISFDVGVNNTISTDICSDKDITSEVLSFANVPCVEHKLFRISSDEKDKEIGIMNSITEKAKEWNMDIVIKRRSGSGGSGVYHIKNEIELERAILRENLWRGIVMSPYKNIVNEYRVLILGNKSLCIYKKNRISLKGDGKSTLIQLITSQVNQNNQSEVIASLSSDKANLNTILKEGEEHLISWKHNLDRGGAEPEMSENSELNTKLLDIAKKSINAIGMNYAAVDIIETDNNEFLVLEINSTPTYYNFIKFYGKENFSMLLKELISLRLEQEQQKSENFSLEKQLEFKVEQKFPYITLKNN